MTMLQHGLVPSTGGYQIERSLRFNSADSAYLNRTPGSAGNRKTWTWSGWVKRSVIGSGTYEVFIAAASSGGTSRFTGMRFIDDQLYIQDVNTSTHNIWWVTSAVFRDPSAWYHFVVKYDTTQASSSNAVALWVNGVAQTLTFAAPSGSYAQNRDGYVNATNDHYLGTNQNSSGVVGINYFPGYLADVHLIDGSALTPSSFGENDTDTGVWKPKAYTGSYGTNGFKLTFSDNSNTTSTTLGKDTSGNGNNWTPNNFSVTAGAGNDSLVDTPTPYGTDTGAGGEVRGNYCTLNPLNSTATLFNGNLDSGTSSGIANWLPTSGTIGVSSGKWYWEVRMNSAEYLQVGILPTAYRAVSGDYPGSASTTGYGYQSANGNKYVLGTGSSYGATFTTGDVIGVALDLDGGTLVFYKNGSSQGTAASSISGTFVPGIAVYNSTGASTVANCNFGQRPFAYTAPSGFKALCTTNLPTPTIGATSSTRADDYFNIALYTGNNSTNAITGLGFSPDLVWIKSRSNAENNLLFDTNRGRGYGLYSNLTNAEAGPSPSDKDLVSFDSDGFTLGQIYNFNVNDSGKTFVGWAWRGSDSAAVSNTAGSITSTVSANTTAGFSIVTWSPASTASTVGHGLGVAPGMIIMKPRDSATGWFVYHKNSPKSGSATDYLVLNSTAAATGNSTVFSTAPTSTVFDPGTGFTSGNGYGSMLAYCFAPVAGYSAFGSYTGNGSTDGPFVYTGFRPRYIMVKGSTATTNWTVIDTARDTYNACKAGLYPNLSNAESDPGAFDILSNGFKIRHTYTDSNGNGNTYIYMALAEVPAKFSLAR